MEDRVVLRPRPTQLVSRGAGSQNLPPQSEPPRRKKKKKNKLLQGAIVTIGAMALTVLAINASDSFKSDDAQLAGVAGSSKEARCPSEMVFVSSSSGGFCIDRYEASASKPCPHADPNNQFETNDNISQPLCLPVSEADASPWVNIPQSQAMELCARAGKHLASNAEWYRAALGTPDRIESDNSNEGCVLGKIGVSRGEKTGKHSACVSSSGAFDMVGNVWEWVDGNISDGIYQKRELPEEGYVAEADVDGVPVRVATTSSDVFHGDYFYIKRDGVSGMLRGGFWNLTERAGVATINATIPLSFVGSAVGFRCAK